jgi:hypothetical protein
MGTMKNRFIAGFLVVVLSAGALPSRALAVMIPTDAVAPAATGARDRVALALSRAEVRAQLEAYGVNPADVRARVDALSDADVAQLSGRIDSLASGGDGFIGALVFVFLVLLITDIIGLTKVFPFTRPIK